MNCDSIIYEEVDFCGNMIRQRISDGYINATDMCNANKKKYSGWFRLESTKEYLKELSLNTGYDTLTLVEVKVGGGNKNSGTWVHPYVAINLAQWLSPKFAVFVSKLVFRYISGDATLIEEIKHNNEVLNMQIKNLQDENKEKDERLNRMYNIQKELLSYKKSFTKDETIYIASTKNYARQGIYKIGRTRKHMKLRSSGLNTSHVVGDKMKVITTFKVSDCVLVEKNIHTKLNGLRVKGEREFFMCPYDILESVVDLIVHNDDEENDVINRIIETVYRLKESSFSPNDWMSGIPEDTFKEVLCITDGENELAEFDVSRWDETRKQEFVAYCLKEYIKRENGFDENEFQIAWKAFQTFMISQLSIPKSKFKVSDWKNAVKEEVDKEKINIKWRSR